MSVPTLATPLIAAARIIELVIRLEGKRTEKGYNLVFYAGHGRIIKKSQKPIAKCLLPI